MDAAYWVPAASPPLAGGRPRPYASARSGSGAKNGVET
jgi:hypothetical protein